jgi:two-component system chemotaxis response regulator CheB
MKRDIVVIGAPVGGAAALAQLVRGLPRDLNAAVFVVLHTAPDTPILLADVLNAPGGIRAAAAMHGEGIQRARVYVAIEKKHLLLRSEAVELSAGNGRVYRPSIDALFESAAECYQARVVGVILLHAREEGCDGLRAIRRAGGRTVTHRNHFMPAPLRHAQTGELLSDDHAELEEIAGRLLAYAAGQE